MQWKALEITRVGGGEIPKYLFFSFELFLQSKSPKMTS